VTTWSREGATLRERDVLGSGTAMASTMCVPSVRCTPVKLPTVKPHRARWTSLMCQAMVLGVAAVLLLLPSLTYLEQPDPLWIGGIWDDDDFDAVVVLVKSTEISCEPPQSVFVPIEPCLYATPPAPVWRPFIVPVRWPENRAPPHA